MKLRVAGISIILAVFAVVFSCNAAMAAAPTVKLTWTAPVPPAGATWVASGYNIYRADTPAGYVMGTHISPSLVNALTYTDTTVQSGHTYYYNITTWCATCTVGNQESAFDTEIKVVIPAAVVGPPNAPGNLAAVVQ